MHAALRIPPHGNNVLQGSDLGFSAAEAASASAVAAQQVATARVAEGLAAAQREAAFEHALRLRAEAAGSVLRSTLARLRQRAKLNAQHLEALKEASITKDEHTRSQQELTQAREQLRLARGESARRAKALSLLQGLPQGPDGAVLGAQHVPRVCLELAAMGGDPVPAAAEAAAAAASAAAGALEEERVVRVGLEGKLKEARALLERKNTLVK